MILLTGTAWQNRAETREPKTENQTAPSGGFCLGRFGSKSFTIIEVVLVILVVAIIAGLAVPRFSRTYADLALKTTAEEIAQLMRYAQSRAIIKGKEVRLETDAGLSVYYLTEQADDQKQEGGEDTFVRFEGRFGRVFGIPSLMEVKRDKDYVSFYPDGSIDKQYLNVCNEKRCFTISTKEQRGHVRVIQHNAP